MNKIKMPPNLCPWLTKKDRKREKYKGEEERETYRKQKKRATLKLLPLSLWSSIPKLLIAAPNPAVKALKIPRNFCNQSYSNFVNKTPRESRITVIGKKGKPLTFLENRKRGGSCPENAFTQGLQAFLPVLLGVCWENAGLLGNLVFLYTV